MTGRTIAELADRLSVAPHDVAGWLVEWERQGIVECSWRLADDALNFEVRSLALDPSESEPDDGSWRSELGEDEEDDVRTLCVECGDPLRASVRQRRGRYCSSRCRQRARVRRSNREEARGAA